MSRLPTPGSDSGTWGDILNDYLSVEHNADGTLKASGSLSSKVSKAGDTMSGPLLLPGNPTAALQAATKDYVDNTAVSGAPDADATTKGLVQLAGDLSGTAASPQIAAGAIVNADVNAAAAIDQSKLALDADLTTIAALAPTNDDVIQRKAGAWTNSTMAQIKTDLALVKGDVGLGNVDNTSDASKPVSTTQQTALDLKANDDAVVKLTGDQTVAGIKTFSSSPIVPTPTASTQAAQKATVDDHINDTLGAHAASAISFTPAGEITAVNVQAVGQALDSRLSQLLNFSPDYLHGYSYSYDDFFGDGITSGIIGDLGWTLATANGGAITAGTTLPNGVNRPGFYVIGTGTSATNGMSSIHLGVQTLTGHPLFIWETCMAPVLLSNGTHNATIRIGLHDDVSGVDPTDGYYFELVGTGITSTWHCLTAKNGVRSSSTDTGVFPAAITYARYRIVSDGGGAIYFYIDDILVATHTNASYIPSTDSEGFGRAFTIIKTLGTGTARQWRIDYEYLLWAVTR